jgi:hypothetical protein
VLFNKKLAQVGSLKKNSIFICYCCCWKKIGDGCGAVPMVGYRYHCSKCANHDVCETCYNAWDNGNGVLTNNLAQQKLSSDPKDHSFKVYKDNSFKSLVKSGGSKKQSEPSAKKPKPNDPCSCGSGKKFKKCCGTGTTN